MISSIITIVIPCMNNVLGVKTTIENLSTKSKINGTRILVLDFGSKDGSYQYVAQASSEMIRSLKIESIKAEAGQSVKDFKNIIHTEYVLVVSPGTIFNDKDFVLKSINDILGYSKYPIVYLKQSTLINNMLSRFINKNRRIGAILSKTEVMEDIKFDHEISDLDINLKNKSVSGGIKIGGFADI